jgi:hypothetical protein
MELIIAIIQPHRLKSVKHREVLKNDPLMTRYERPKYSTVKGSHVALSPAAFCLP